MNSWQADHYYHASDILDPEIQIYYEAGKDILDEQLPHSHDFFELFLILEGRCDHLVNSRVKSLVAGDLVFIRDSDIHAYRPVDDAPCIYVNLAFSRELMDHLHHLLGVDALGPLLSAEEPPVYHFDPTTREQVRIRLERVFGFVRQEAMVVRAQGAALIAQFLARYLVPWVQEAGRPAWLNDFLREMSKPAHIREGLPAMRRLSEVSYSQLARMLERHLGMNPTGYLQSQRIRLAQQLLTTTREPITEIAFQTGFQTLSYFNRSFRELTGMTPSEWRKLEQVTLI